MIKTILVPATGSHKDDGVFTSALAVARALDAHLDFLHVRADAAAMAAAMASDGGGAAMVTGLVERIDEEVSQREESAKQLFQRFCERERLVVADSPIAQPGPTAQWHQQTGDEAYWVTEYGHSADLLVIGRPGDNQRAPSEALEAALINSGRPLLIPPSAPISTLPDTVVIAWKSTPEASRAVAAAMPFLSIAKQIVIITVAEKETTIAEEGAVRLLANLRWDGFSASVRHLEPGVQGAAETLLAAAREQAGLLVMGGYGHSRLREWIFGGFTQRVLREAEIPVLLAH